MGTRAALVCALVLTVSACGGSESSSSDAAPTKTTAGTDSLPDSADDAVAFTAEPVQLTVDPCTLVTKTEAETLIGPANDSGTYDPPKCIYTSSENTGGQLAVSLTEPEFCKLLFLALDQNMFSDVQVRVDVGDGGMLVKGLGNVQFAVDGGCVEVSGNVDLDTKIDDETIVRLANTAAERVA